MSLVAVVAATTCVDIVVVAVIGVNFHGVVIQEVPDDYGVVVRAADYLEFIELEAKYTTGVLYEGLNAKRGC